MRTNGAYGKFETAFRERNEMDQQQPVQGQVQIKADEKELQAVDQEVELLIDQAVEFAQGSSEPLPGSVNDHVF